MRRCGDAALWRSAADRGWRHESYQLQFIDWARPERNVYHVTDEFAVGSFGTTETRRPRHVLFVNGIPFGVIECKRPGKVGGEDPVDQAVNQQLRSQRENEIPRLFHFAQVLFALAVTQAKYGATGTPLPFWQLWREQVLSESGLLDLLRTPLTPEESERTFSSDPHRFNGATPAVARAWLDGVVAAGRTPTEQDWLLYALATPSRLLALASRYTVFEGGNRKLARYQQHCRRRHPPQGQDHGCRWQTKRRAGQAHTGKRQVPHDGDAG